MNICIVYEMNNREFYNCVLLERALIKKGHKVKICNKTEDINLFKSYDITIIPNSYRSSDVDFYRYVFNTKNKIIVVYPCEQVTNHKLPDFYDYSENNKVKKLPHLCWGSDYYDWISGLGYDTSNMYITGAIQLDFCRKEFKTFYLGRNEIAKRFGLDRDKKWVLFISDFVLMNELRYRQYIDTGVINEKTLSLRRDFEEKSKNEILAWIKRFLKQNDGYQIIYRKHPVEILTDEIDSIRKDCKDFFLIHDLNIKEWICNCDVITTWNSTSMIECYVAGVHIGLLRPYSFSDEPMMNEYSFYRNFPSIQTYEEFLKCIIKGPIDYTDNVIKEINVLYSIEEVPAYERILYSIEQIYKTSMFSHIESNYYINRIYFLIKKNILVKIFIKKIYQFFYQFFGFRFNGDVKRRMALAEWTATVNNKKNKKKLAMSIDSIITH